MRLPGGTLGERWLRELAVLYRVLRHPRTPWYVRGVAACAVGYVLSPIQLIPSFIPVIGQLDNVCVLLVGDKLVRALVPDDVLGECEILARRTPPTAVLGFVALSVAAAVAVFLVAYSTG